MLALDDIKGNPLSGVRILHPTLRFKDDTGPILLEAATMHLRYSAFDLLAGRRAEIAVEIDRPILRFSRRYDGSLRTPRWNPGPPSRRQARGFDFLVRLRDAEVRFPEAEYAIQGLALNASASTGRPTKVDVRSLTWRSGPYHSVLQAFAADLAVDDSVHVRVRELRTPDIALRGRADWKRNTPNRPDARLVTASIERVRWGWLAEVFRNKTFDVPGEGAFVVQAIGDREWTGHVRTRSEWDGLPIQAAGDFVWKDRAFRVEPLEGTSPAGNLVGRLAWSKQGWEIGGEAEHADPSQWSAIGVDGWPAGDLAGRFRYQVDTRARPHSRLVAQLESSQWAGWRTDSGGVVVEFPAVGPDSFSVRALRRGGEMTLLGAADNGAWGGRYRIERFPLDEWPDGRASGIKGTLATGEGTVTGHSGILDVTGDLTGVTTDWLGARMARWRLDGVAGTLLPKPDLVANARLEDVMFLGLHFDSVAAPVHLGDQNLDFAGLQAFAGDTLVGMDAHADWDGGGWRLEASRASMKSSGFAWTVEPPLRISGNPQGVTFDHLVATDGPARVHVEGRWATPGGSYDFTARAEHLDLGRLGLPKEWRLSGKADAELKVGGISGDPRWEAVAQATRPGYQGHAADSMSVALTGGPARLDVRSFAWMMDGGVVRAQGRVDDMPKAWPATLTGDGVVAWIADAMRWDGTVVAERAPLDSIGRIAPRAYGVSGRVDGKLTVAGRPGRPELALEIAGRPLAWRGARVDEITARAGYRDGRLVVSELRMAREGVGSLISGEMPLVLAVGRPIVVPNEPMHWSVDVPEGDLALVPLFVPQIGRATGRFTIDAQVAGTPKDPRLTGAARIIDGHNVRLAGREEVLQDLYASFTLGESLITLDSLRARQVTRQGLPGAVAASGALRISDRGLEGYRFDVKMRDFTALETGSYAARFDGDFVITDGPRVGDQVIPRVEGVVEVLRAVVLYDFTRQTEVQQVAASTQRLYWVYKLEVHAKDNLRWQPEDADIEFSADLEVQQTLDDLTIFGEMEALRGSYYFLSNRFNIERARLTFDDVGGIDPVIDAEATTKLRVNPEELGGVGTSTSGTQTATITVVIQGRASEPTFNFSGEGTNLTLDDDQVLQALTVGRYLPGGVGQQTVGSVDSWFTQRLMRTLSPELSRAFRGYLTDWEIARETGGLLRGSGDLVVGVGIPVTSDLAFRVRSRVPGTATTSLASDVTDVDLIERSLEAEYRLTRFISVTSEVAQPRSAATTTTSINAARYNVKLRARWEY